MVKIIVNVPKGQSTETREAAYHRIVHQHLRYADIGLHISEIDNDNSNIEFTINVKNKRWAKLVMERIRSFGDDAKIHA